MSRTSERLILDLQHRRDPGTDTNATSKLTHVILDTSWIPHCSYWNSFYGTCPKTSLKLVKSQEQDANQPPGVGVPVKFLLIQLTAYFPLLFSLKKIRNVKRDRETF